MSMSLNLVSKTIFAAECIVADIEPGEKGPILGTGWAKKMQPTQKTVDYFLFFIISFMAVWGSISN